MTEKIIIDFHDPDEKGRWELINDTVMGGLSRSGIIMTESGTAVFQGEVSLENYGGFSSVRTGLRDLGLAGYGGLIVRIKGDGKDYRLRLRTDDEHEGIAYQAVFSTRAGEWTVARLPFSAFVPVFRGRVIPDAPPLDVRKIRRIGFMIADKQAGFFRLEIADITAYGNPY